MSPLARWVLDQGDADRNSLPLLIIDPWGSLNAESMTTPRRSRPRGVQSHLESLEKQISEWRKTHRVWQVGFINDSALVGCDYYFLNKRSPAQVTRTLELVGLAQAFFGPSSGLLPMAQRHGLKVLQLENSRS